LFTHATTILKTSGNFSDLFRFPLLFSFLILSSVVVTYYHKLNVDYFLPWMTDSLRSAYFWRRLRAFAVEVQRVDKSCPSLFDWVLT